MSFDGAARCPNPADFGYNFTFRTRSIVTYYCRRHFLRLLSDADLFPNSNYTDINITPAKDEDYELQPGV